jgi:hypothetical protein
MDILVLRKRAFSVLLFVAAAGGALALAGCGGGDDEQAAAAAAPPPPAPTSSPSNPAPAPANQSPTIAGAPTSTVMQGNAYVFTPLASDPDGDTLTFTVTNLPGWAAFDSSTGGVSGTPSSADVGTYTNISINVSDGSTNASLPGFSIAVVATATGSTTLTWNPPTQNTDGSPLTDLAGYRVYWGTSQGSYTNSATISNPGLSSYVVDQLTPATWYFAVTAVNAAGAESAHSNTASMQIL